MPWCFSLRSCHKAGAGRERLVTGPAPWPALMLRSAGFSAFRVRILRSTPGASRLGWRAPSWAGLRRGAMAQHLAHDHAELQRDLRGIGFPGSFGYSVRILQFGSPSPVTSPTDLAGCQTASRATRLPPVRSPGGSKRRAEAAAPAAFLPRAARETAGRPSRPENRNRPTPGDGRWGYRERYPRLTEARNRQAAYGGAVYDAVNQESAAQQAAEDAFDAPARGDGTVADAQETADRSSGQYSSVRALFASPASISAASAPATWSAGTCP